MCQENFNTKELDTLLVALECMEVMSGQQAAQEYLDSQKNNFRNKLNEINYNKESAKSVIKYLEDKENDSIKYANKIKREVELNTIVIKEKIVVMQDLLTNNISHKQKVI